MLGFGFRGFRGPWSLFVLKRNEKPIERQGFRVGCGGAGGV